MRLLTQVKTDVYDLYVLAVRQAHRAHHPQRQMKGATRRISLRSIVLSITTEEGGQSLTDPWLFSDFRISSQSLIGLEGILIVELE